MKARVIQLSALIFTLLLTACTQNGIKDAKNWPVNDFTYTDQQGKTFGLKDLEGKIWVADFIFTNCETVCLPMTSNMAKLQKMAKENGIENIQFVSFSVDPSVDTPDALTQYGKLSGVDFNNWKFLTGYEQLEIEKFARDNFKTIVKKPEKGDQVIHGTDFYLIDQTGKIVKDYTGFQEIPFDEIMNDIKALQ